MRLAQQMRAVVRLALNKVENLRPAVALTEEDDELLAAEFDRVHGYGLPLAERSKVAHELAEGAPLVRWSPPAAVHHV